jgi:hypothetical protein
VTGADLRPGRPTTRSGAASFYLCGHCANQLRPALSAQGWAIWLIAMPTVAPGRAARRRAAHLARLEAQVAVETLLTRLPGLRLDPRYPSAPRGLVLRKPAALRVRWEAG